jgi:hypothetical protein
VQAYGVILFVIIYAYFGFRPLLNVDGGYVETKAELLA